MEAVKGFGGAGSVESPMLSVGFAGRVGSGRKGNKRDPYDKIFKVVFSLLISLRVDQAHTVVPCHGSSFAWIVKAIDFFFPALL